jgi:hypothetical protein
MVTDADRRRISRAIDAETDRRLAAKWQPPSATDRAAATAAKQSDMERQKSDAWAKWISQRINDHMDVFAEQLGKVLAELRTKDGAKVRRFVDTVATDLRAEFKSALDAAKAEMLAELRQLTEKAARPRPTTVPANPRPALALPATVGDA